MAIFSDQSLKFINQHHVTLTGISKEAFLNDVLHVNTSLLLTDVGLSTFLNAIGLAIASLRSNSGQCPDHAWPATAV